MENLYEELHALSFLHQDEQANHHSASSFQASSANVEEILSPIASSNLDDAFGSNSGFDNDDAAQDDSEDAEPGSPASNLSSPVNSAPSVDGGNAVDGISSGNLNSRNWRLVHLSGLLLANKVNAIQNLQYFVDKININVRTRSEASSLVVPERLYSSLKYEMRHTVQSDILLDSTNVLMCKVEVVNPEDYQEEILNTNGQKLIKGIQEVTAMSKNAAGTTLECKMKIQFTSVSYHHEKKYFAFKVSFIDPLIHVSEPVLVLVSGPFQVFARRPTSRSKKETAAPSKKSKKQQVADKKRKVSAPSSNESEASSPVSPPKKQKPVLPPVIIENKPIVDQSAKIQLKNGASLNDFVKCLDLLIAFKNSLASDDQKVAMEVVQQKLLSHSKASKKNQQQQQMSQEHIASFLSDL